VNKEPQLVDATSSVPEGGHHWRVEGQHLRTLHPPAASQAAESTHRLVVPHAAGAPESTRHTARRDRCAEGQTTQGPLRHIAAGVCMFQAPWPRVKIRHLERWQPVCDCQLPESGWAMTSSNGCLSFPPSSLPVHMGLHLSCSSMTRGRT
jgi:hypothetical protein